MANEGYCRWLGNRNANQQFALAQSQGLSTGNDAVVGGVICWDDGVDGHCAVIERVIDADTVETSESGWNYQTAPVVKTFTRYRVGGVWQYRADHTCQGVIYPPGYTPGGTGEDYYIMWLQGEGLWKL